MGIRRTQALFTKKPRVLGEITIFDTVEKLRPVRIEKTIILSKIDYKNFITDMTVERLFLRNYSPLCRIDDKGIWHSLLVVQLGSQAGILVMADQEGIPLYAARFRMRIHSPLLRQHLNASYSDHKNYQ
jgi:hypothetical protein